MLSAIIISPDEAFRDGVHANCWRARIRSRFRAELNNFYSSLDSWIFNEIKTMEADIIIVDVAPDKEQGILTVEKILEISKHGHIFVSGDGTDAELILRSMRAGAKEFLSAPIDSKALLAAIERLSKVQDSVTKEKKRFGKLFTFFSAKGGTGSTVISTNFAVSLVEQTKKSTIWSTWTCSWVKSRCFSALNPPSMSRTLQITFTEWTRHCLRVHQETCLWVGCLSSSGFARQSGVGRAFADSSDSPVLEEHLRICCGRHFEYLR